MSMKAERGTKPRPQNKKQNARQADGEIILPEAAPAPEGVTRRDRRPVSH